MLAGARNQPIRLRASNSKNKGRWLEAIEHCEDAFAHNPWDYHAAIIAAEAAEGLELPVLSKWLLESVAAQGAEDVNYLRHLARSYEKNEDWDRSIACWEKLRKLSPSDDEAIRKIRGLEASATISRSGLGDAIHRANEASAGPDAPLPPDVEELKRQAMTPEERLRKQIEEEPDRVGLVLDLAEMLKNANKLDEAEKVLSQGIKSNPAEELLREAHGNIQLARLQRAIAAWNKRLREAARRCGGTRQGRAAYGDAERVPDQGVPPPPRATARGRPGPIPAWAMPVKVRTMGRGDRRVPESASRLESEGKSPFLTGQCFESKELPKLAERNYSEALKAIDDTEQDLFNLLHYRLGRVAESQGDLKAAEEHYNEVAANDFGYEDIAQRLENLNRRP